MASPVSFDVHYGVALKRVESAAQVVSIVSPGGRRQGKTAAMKLSEAVRKGIMRSAWGDMDEPDDTGLGYRGDVVPSAAEIREKERIYEEMMRAERDRAKAAQEAIINKAIELQRQQAAEQTRSELEELEGFGTF